MVGKGRKLPRMDKAVKVSISIPESVLRLIQVRAEKENRNLSNMVTELAKRGMKKGSQAA